MERTSLAFAVSFLGNWRAGAARAKDFWGLREGPSRSRTPTPPSLSLSLSCSYTVNL